MFKSLVIKSSLAAGLAMIGALVLAPQEASAGFRFGGGGFHAAPHFAMARPAFHPTFRPAFHPAFRSAFHAAPRRAFGGYRPTRSAGLARHGGFGQRGHERTRLGRLEHERGHMHLPHGRIAPAFYQPDDAAPDAPDFTPAVAGPDVAAPVSGGPALGGPASTAGQSAKPVVAASCTSNGSSVAVTFAPKATATDISNFLKAYGVTIVDGPNKDGRYQVRLSDKLLPPNEVMQAVQSMQTQTAIVSTVAVF